MLPSSAEHLDIHQERGMMAPGGAVSRADVPVKSRCMLCSGVYCTVGWVFVKPELSGVLYCLGLVGC